MNDRLILDDELLTNTIAIGHDFDTYGGDVVMLLAAKQRAEEEVMRGPSKSTRARIRQKVNLSLVEIRFARLFGRVCQDEARIRSLEKACRAMRAQHGRYWLADTLADYYVEVRPVPDPVSAVMTLTSVAARVIAEHEAHALN